MYALCTGIATISCGLDITCDQIGTTLSITIQALENGDYKPLTDASFHVWLSTNPGNRSSIWDDYTLPAVKVNTLTLSNSTNT